MLGKFVNSTSSLNVSHYRPYARMATHGPWTVNAKNRTVACALVNYANAPLWLINLVIYRRPTFSFPLLDFNPSTAFDGGGDAGAVLDVDDGNRCADIQTIRYAVIRIEHRRIGLDVERNL